MKKQPHHMVFLEKLSVKATTWIGSTASVVFHTLFFLAAFSLRFFHVVLSDILLILTTIVSLEAIYLAIFIQMSVNRQLREVNKEIDDVQEDVEEIQEELEEDLTDSARLQRVEKMLLTLSKNGSGQKK